MVCLFFVCSGETGSTSLSRLKEHVSRKCCIAVMRRLAFVWIKEPAFRIAAAPSRARHAWRFLQDDPSERAGVH